MEELIDKKSWYDRWFKVMLFPPLALLIFCLVYLGLFYNSYGDFILRDPSLSGGTTIIIQSDFDAKLLADELKKNFEDVQVRTIDDIASGKQLALIISSLAEQKNLQTEVERILNVNITTENSSVEFSGPTLGTSFYRQLIIALIISFVLISIVVFFLFRTFIPSVAVILSIFADVVMSLTLVNYLGIRLSAAGIAAFLMLIGYSVDTDILLTTRVLKKREGSVNERIYSSFKTGIFMTSTSLLAVLPAFFLFTGLPDSFKQIFLIVSFGLFADIINTWLANASIIKWYTKYKGIK